MSLPDEVLNCPVTLPGSRTTPFWKGPAVDGVTQSLLAKYLVCEERFRIRYMLGLSSQEQWNPRLGYGEMWHLCEEAYAGPTAGKLPAKDNQLQIKLADHCRKLCAQFKLQQADINHWYEMCRAQFPHYAKHWAAHPDVTNRKPLLQEQKFKVPIQLPSGRVIWVRGKWDSVDLIKDQQGRAGVWLQENKTKSTIQAWKIAIQLKFDFQTMIYLLVIRTLQDYAKGIIPEGLNTEDIEPRDTHWGNIVGIDQPLRGVRYNVIRRSSHKTAQSMEKKILEDQSDGRIGEWFARWNVQVSWPDICKFCLECLHPVLENLLDDYEWWTYCMKLHISHWDYQRRANKFPKHHRRHYRMPYGIYSPLLENDNTELDEFLATGNTTGLRDSTVLFPELQ